ncbi:MAG: hypothetical protein L0Z50_20255, partial [Verrucomicrobiales bacterium]|nr:hypothetical protein [Verrucomicrobiales bacterium]
AVSQGFQPADAGKSNAPLTSDALPIWKSAIRQVWKPGLETCATVSTGADRLRQWPCDAEPSLCLFTNAEHANVPAIAESEMNPHRLPRTNGYETI